MALVTREGVHIGLIEDDAKQIFVDPSRVGKRVLCDINFRTTPFHNKHEESTNDVTTRTSTTGASGDRSTIT